jgi:hypothetical protein
MTEPVNEAWFRKLCSHYEKWERTVPAEDWMALARVRNQALSISRSRFWRRFWILSCAGLALAAIGLVFVLPPPGARMMPAHPEIVNAPSQLLGRGNSRLYEHLSFYRWLALHEKARLG